MGTETNLLLKVRELSREDGKANFSGGKDENKEEGLSS